MPTSKIVISFLTYEDMGGSFGWKRWQWRLSDLSSNEQDEFLKLSSPINESFPLL